MRAQSMNIQFTSESRSYQPQSKQQRFIQQEEKAQNAINKKYPNYAYALTTENSYVPQSMNVRFGQGILGLKNKSANNKRSYQVNQKMISNSNGFHQQDMPQLSGSFTPVLLDANQKIIQKQQKQLESMQANNNILINRSKMQSNNNKAMQPGTFYSKQNQMQSPQYKKQQTYEDSYFHSDNQIVTVEMKNSSQMINDYSQQNLQEMAKDANYKKLKDVIQYEQSKSGYVIDASHQKLKEKKKQLDQLPSPHSYNQDTLPTNQISIFTQNRINTNNQINDMNEEDEDQWDQFQLRQFGQTQQDQQIIANEKNLIRQTSMDTTSEARKGAIRYNTSMAKSNVIVQSNTSNYQRPQINSPPPLQQKVFLSPQRNEEKNALVKSNVPLSQQNSSSKSTVVRRSYSAVKNPTTIKKEEPNRTKKINPNDLMILKIKEQCTNKKYNDPIGIKKEKAKQKQQSDLKQSRKMNFTSTGGYNSKVKDEVQIRIRSLKDSQAAEDQFNNNLGEEDDDDDDSMMMSNDVSLDLDEDDDDAKQAISSPLGGFASTQDSLPNSIPSKPRVALLKSVYQGRPSTIFFPYHKSCQQPQPRDTSRTIQITEFETKKFNLKYKINGENPYKCVVKAFEEAGFENTDEGDWNCVWSLPKKDRVKNMNHFQKQNHFPGCWNLGRKDFMWRCLNRVKRKYPKEMDFVPNTYLLCNQGDWDRFQARREEASKHQLWILKPADQACGRGVKVISKTTKVKRKSNRIICDYIANPHLINGLKYDLRLYVLVTSYDPLRIYLFEEGLTRFATEKYTTNTKEVSKRYVHLTNYSVNKHAKKFVKNTNSEVDGEGSKWSLTALKAKYKQMGINVDELFGRIKDVIIKTCISAEPQMLDIVAKSQEHRTNCFELYGFDILIDSSLKPWILEVNVCPSLSSSSPLDRKIKHSLLVDVLNIIGLIPYDKKQYTEDKKNNMFTRAFNSTASNILDSIDNDKTSSTKKNFSKNVNDIQDLNYENCLDKLSPENWEVLFETDEEFYRRGHFERIYPMPSKEKLDYYSQFYDFQRFNNIIIQKWMTSNSNFLEKILKKRYHTVV